MRNFKSASAHALLYSSILASGLLLVNGASVTKSYAAACDVGPALVTDGANSTSCINGSSNNVLTYVASNAVYAAGNFTLILVNHDVTAAAGNGITFSGVVGDGFITLQNDSDVVSGAGGDGINASANAAGEDLTINVLDTSSVSGAADGIEADTAAGSITVNTAAGTTVTGTAGDGINATVVQSGNVVVNALGAVTGGTNGIVADAADAALFVGTVTVTTGTSAVTGNAGDGIFAISSLANTVTTGGNVTGTGGDGIDATSTFGGNVTVTTAAGTTVSGTAGDGINADANLFGASVLVTANGNVTGSVNGIDADAGSGTLAGGSATVITTDNSTGGQTISGGTGDGIQATGGFGGTSGGDAMVTITDNSTFGTTVSGGNNGITATGGFGGTDFGGAATVGITANSTFGATTITGTAGDGIAATGGDGTWGGAATVTITDNSTSGTTVTGGVNGITATGGDGGTWGGDGTVEITDNSSSGTTVTGGVNGITATGGDGGGTFGGDATVEITDDSTFGTTITGTAGDGIAATGGAGGTFGGDATVEITDNSTFGTTVTGGVNGITATGGAGGRRGGAAMVTINGSTFGTTVTGGVNGIMALGGFGGTSGGDATVTINGGTFGTFGTTVTGTTGAGIFATGGAGFTGGDVTVNVDNAIVQGAVTGIDAGTATGSIITINNGTFGLIQNLSGDDADLAILTSGGHTTINNGTFGATITGRIVTGVGDDTLNNGGTWNTDGTSNFGAGIDAVNNTSSGFISVGNDAGVANTTSFVGLEALNNSGFISMLDQSSGDGSNISDRLETDGNYTGTGGGLGVDAFLGGPGSVADVFAVGGDTSGTTSIVVNNTNPGGGGLNDGILVVDVTGTASAGDFALAGGPIDAGFFVYDLEFNNTDQANDQFLLVSSADAEVFETAATVAGAQEIWRETASAWETRQQAVRDKLAGGAVVSAVADPVIVEDVAENGLWIAALGSWSERDYEDGGFDLSYEQDILGVVGGADFGADMGNGGNLLFGLLAGYVDSNLDFDNTSTSVEYDGGTFGAYASWMGGGFFLNVLGKVDLLEMDYSTSVGDDDTDVTSYGGRADVGYRFGGDSLFLEPMVSVDVISTDIDEFTVGGVDIDAGTNESFRGGVGVRAGFGGEMVRVSATGRVWEVFSNDIEVDVAGVDVSDESLEGTYGEAAAQVDVDVSTSMMLFLRGSVLVSDDITKPAVSGGFNWSW